MDRLTRFFGILDKVLEWVTLIFGGAVLAFMTCFSVFNVLVMRKALNAPIRGAEDLLILALVTVVALAIPYGGRTGSHVEIEAAQRFMGARMQKLTLLAMKGLAVGLLLVLSWRLHDAGTNASRFGESSQQLLISFEPFYYLLSASVLAYALIVMADIAQLLLRGAITLNRPAQDDAP